MLEKLFLEEWEWWYWGILFCLSLAGLIFALWKLYQLENSPKDPPKNDSELVDYMTATAIASRYIDPDNTMTASVLITVRSQILAKFDKVVGARVGENYNGPLLHQWFQKNAARALVNHQNEIV